MSAGIVGISSKATQQVLADLATAYRQRSGVEVAIESVGGVDAARRVQGGEAFDVVFLAADAIDKLLAGGHLLAGSRVDLVRSPVAVAVRAGAPRPDIGDEQALKTAVRAARGISYSTGPSGTFLLQLFQRWAIADETAPRLVQAPPGVPVGALVARGDADLGFQQLSELMHQPGIDVLGVLPPDVAFITTFSAGIVRASTCAAAVREMLAYFTSPEADAAKLRHGMQPA